MILFSFVELRLSILASTVPFLFSWWIDFLSFRILNSFVRLKCASKNFSHLYSVYVIRKTGLVAFEAIINK